MTEILPITSRRALNTARRLLREGDVVAFPTDTVYGLGAPAFETYTVRQIFALKKRPPEKGLPVFIADINDLNLVAHGVPNYAWPLLQALWPGALTVILPKVAALPLEVTSGQPNVAIRIPNHHGCLELVRLVGYPLAVTSANISGQPTPMTAQAVAKQLGRELPLVLDGGPSPSEQPPSIVDLTTTPPRLVRQGAIPLETLRVYLPDLQN